MADEQLCRHEYQRPGGRERGDRIIRCGLTDGHEGEFHAELFEGEVTVEWPRQSDPPVATRLLDREVREWTAKYERLRLLLAAELGLPDVDALAEAEVRGFVKAIEALRDPTVWEQWTQAEAPGAPETQRIPFTPENAVAFLTAIKPIGENE